MRPGDRKRLFRFRPHSDLMSQAVQGYFESSLRLCFAHALSAGTAFMFGEFAPQAHLPSFFAMDMQGQDFVPPQAQT